MSDLIRMIEELAEIPKDDRYGKLGKLAECLVALDDMASKLGFGRGAVAAYAAVIRRDSSSDLE